MNFFSNFLHYKIIVLITVTMLMPISVYAEHEHHDGSAQTLGWVSIGTGVVANLLFVGFNAIKKFPLLKVGIGSEISKAGVSMYKPLLNFHIMLNSVGFFAGMSHGIMLLRGIDSISLSLAIVMIFSMISGIILKFESDRNLKFFGRLVHGQVILSILLISLVTLHVVTMGGDFD
jgi:hypothetical protein